MKKFAWGICYTTSKCHSREIVLEILKRFSETWLFCVFQDQVSWLVYCHTYFENIHLSGNKERLLWTPGMDELLKEVPLSPVVPVPAQPQSAGESCPIYHFAAWVTGKSSLSLLRALISDSQLTSFPQKYRLFLL